MPMKRLSTEGGWAQGSVPARTLGPERDGLGGPTLVGEENETFFMRVWKPLPSRLVLKSLRGSLKGKAQKGQYPLALRLSLAITLLLLG